MNELWRRTLSRKYAEVLDVYGDVVGKCPDELWEASVWPVKRTDSWVWPLKRTGERAWPAEAEMERLLPVISAFWNVAYHGVFHIDFYLSGGALPYKAPKPFKEADHRPNTVPGRAYSPHEIMGYIGHCHSKARSIIGELTDARAAEITPRGGQPFLDLLFHNLLHAQEHAGQLTLFLGQHGVHAGYSRRQALRNAVRDRTDDELDAWVRVFGGYDRLLPPVFEGLMARLDPREDATLAFDVGRQYTVQVQRGKAKLLKKPPAGAPATVRTSSQDFLRWMTGDLELAEAMQDGRIRIEGDARSAERFFALLR